MPHSTPAVLGWHVLESKGIMKQALLIVALTAACMVGGCGKSKEDQLVGTWRDTSEDRFDSTLTFNKDGSLLADVLLKVDTPPNTLK